METMVDPPNPPLEASPSLSEPKSMEDRPMLAALLDVATVDQYLLQTYLVPSFLEAIVWLQKSLTLDGSSSWNTNAATRSTDAGPLTKSVVRGLVPLVALWITRGRTPAMRQMGLELVAAEKCQTPRNAQKKPMFHVHNRLLVYAMLQFVLPEVFPWLRQGLQKYIAHLSAANSPPTTDDATNLLARQRQLAVWQRLDRFLERLSQRLVPLIQLATLLLCWTGVLHTSEPALVLSGLSYQSSSSLNAPKELHRTLAHRRWLMHQLLQTFRSVLLPSLILIPRIWQPLLRRLLSSIHQSTVPRLRRFLLPRRPDTSTTHIYPAATTAICPLCQHRPPTVAVQADCTCQQVYCYACFYKHAYRTTQTSLLRHASSSSYTLQPTINAAAVHCVRCQDVIHQVTTIHSGHYDPPALS